jgi:hypothetical protein
MLQPSNISNYMPKDENGDKGTRTETDFDRSFDQDSFILKLPNFDFKQGKILLFLCVNRRKIVVFFAMIRLISRNYNMLFL